MRALLQAAPSARTAGRAGAGPYRPSCSWIAIGGLRKDKNEESEETLLYGLEYTRDLSSNLFDFAKIQGSADSATDAPYEADTFVNQKSEGIPKRHHGGGAIRPQSLCQY